MTVSNFAAALAFTLQVEGGWSDDPRDKGGPTNHGITLTTLQKYYRGATLNNLRSINNFEVADIYRDGYWRTVRGDDLPAGVDLSVFDFGVTSDPSRSIRLLQDAVNVTADGILGPISMRAVAALNPVVLIGGLWGRQMTYYEGLPTFKVFGKGWTARAHQRRTAALRLAGAEAA